MIKVLIVAAVLVFGMAVLSYIMFSFYKNERNENVKLKELLDNQKKNMAFLVKHIDELTVIFNSKSQTEQKIREAKTDEEIADIINTVIEFNNSKL